MDYAIEAKELEKVFFYKVKTRSQLKNFFFPKRERIKAVDNISFKIKQGEKIAILGPNGAGKTTLIRLLTGLLMPTKGSVLIKGKSLEENIMNVGLMLGKTMVYHRISGFDNLKYFAKLYGVENYRKRINELSELLELKKFLHTLVENYSLGMKSKLALARALLHEPEILFLDEPTMGLDPKMATKIREKIKEMDKTILLTTHYVEEAIELCDRILIMKNGRIVKSASSKDFAKSADSAVKAYLKALGE